MGAGYIAGATSSCASPCETHWHRIQVGFLPVTAFTLFMAIGTFNHLDRFATAHVAFWIWVGLYVVTPVLVPLAWWRNRATDPGRRNRASRRSRLRAPVAAHGGRRAVGGRTVLLLSPSTMIEHWPWELTPLTAQTLGGWFALPGVTALMMGLDGRWTAIQITLESQLIGLALILVERSAPGRTSIPRTRSPTSSWPASPAYSSRCSRSSGTCSAARARAAAVSHLLLKPRPRSRSRARP